MPSGTPPRVRTSSRGEGVCGSGAAGGGFWGSAISARASSLETPSSSSGSRTAPTRPGSPGIPGKPASPGSQAIQEVTPAITYTFEKFPARIVADMPFNINAPVVIENGVGAYVLNEQPDQVSYAATKAGSYINRQLVINARLMLQAAF